MHRSMTKTQKKHRDTLWTAKNRGSSCQWKKMKSWSKLLLAMDQLISGKIWRDVEHIIVCDGSPC